MFIPRPAVRGIRDGPSSLINTVHATPNIAGQGHRLDLARIAGVTDVTSDASDIAVA